MSGCNGILRPGHPPDPSRHTSYCENDSDHTEKCTARIQHDHHGRPYRTLVIPEIEIEAVKAMVDPPLKTFTTCESAHHSAQMRIDVEPCGVRIRKLDAQNG